MKIKTIGLTLGLCFFSGAACFAADDPNMGTWKLNEAKSKTASGMEKLTTVVYEAAGDQVKVTIDGTDANGKPIHNEWTGKFDGKDYAVTGDGVVFSVELTRPLIVYRLTVRVGAIDGNFHLVACSLINNSGKLFHAGSGLRFSFIQLPRTHIRVVGGEARCPREKAKPQSQSNCFYLHASNEHGFSSTVNVSFQTNERP